MRFAAVAGAALALSTFSAYADDALDLSAILTLTSDYRIRGVSQNDRQLSPQLEVDWNGPDGWSLDGRAMKVNFKDREGTSIETDLVAGKQLTVSDTTVDFQVTYFAYPNHDRPKGAPRYSLVEFSGSASHAWGAFTATAFVSWSPDYFGETGNGEYVSGSVSYQFTPWLSASGDLGEQWVARFDGVSHSGLPYANWDLGVTASWRKFSLDLRYEDTGLSRVQCLLTQGGSNWCAAGIVATLAYQT
jgi:uncharacterized protein (TIGR02001 family)